MSETIQVTQDNNRLVLTISPSSLNEFQLCPRRYFYYKEYEPVGPLRADALDLGSVGHKALEVFYLSDEAHDVRVHKACEEARRAGLETQLAIEDIEHLIETIKLYLEYRKGEDLQVHAVEAPFSKLLHEDDKVVILLEGRQDLIATWMGQRSIFDHKFVKQNRTTLPLSNQNLAYAFATGIKRVVINKVGLQKTLKPHERFVREPFTYEPSQLAEWHHSTVSHWMNLLIHYMEQEKELNNGSRASAWPMNFTSCDKFSGCSFAKFVCSSLPETRESKLLTFYKKKTPRDMFAPEIAKEISSE